MERITVAADGLGLPIEVGLFTATPLPDTYLIATPLADLFDVFADNQPGVEIEEVRLGLFTKGNYLAERDRLTIALLEAGLTVTARRYVAFEPDTGYHHYGIDLASHNFYTLQESK
ncbi:hypothetical protein [Actinomyces mediterranea]